MSDEAPDQVQGVRLSAIAGTCTERARRQVIFLTSAHIHITMESARVCAGVPRRAERRKDSGRP
ncbi:MAG: hypothetical protein NC924_07070 [Candidatus Omnitrophica bacterium]|nr:hypothetical protein [Candidatus Omnitrophota bacterium]